MYDRLWEENPRVQQIRAESEARGQARGELHASQQLVVDIIEVRFPSLVELARQRVGRITGLKDLRQLAKQIAAAPDESTARWVLGTYAA